MKYKYDYYVAYAVLPENATEYMDPNYVKDYNDFVDAFISKLENSSEFQAVFGRKARVYCCKRFVIGFDDWDKNIYPEMASSRLCIVLLSLLYFQNYLYGYEFMRWQEREVYTRLLGSSVIPMYMCGYGSDHYNYLRDVPAEVIEKFPYASVWANYLNAVSLNESVDMHDFQISKIDDSLHCLIDFSRRLFEIQDKSESSPCNNAYPQMSNHYITQHDYLYDIRNAFTDSKTKKSALLYGLSGVGKTETALAYGYAYAWDYELGRIFISCEKKASIKSVLLASGIADMFGWDIPPGTEDDQFAFLIQKLQQKHDEYLKQNQPVDGKKSLSYGGNMFLILDNVNQPELVSEKNLGLLPNFIHVIVTTRRATSQYKHLLNLPVSSLSSTDSVDLLKSYRPIVNEEDLQYVQRIIDHFAGFPAPLTQIGFYLRINPQISYSAFYSMMAEHYTGILMIIADTSSQASNRPVKSIINSMKNTYDKLSPNAQMFLEFTEVVSYNAIPVPWICDCWGIDEKQFEDAVEELKEYNILSFEEDEPHLGKVNSVIMRYKMHKNESLVFEKAPVLFERSLALLEGDFSYWASGKNLWELKAIDGIYTRFMNDVDDIQKVIDLRLPDQFLRIGQIYKDLKIYNKAKQIFIKNAKLCHNILDVFPDDIPTQKFLSNSYERMGNIVCQNGSGNVNEAKQWYEAELEIDKRLADAEPDDLVSQTNLGFTYARMSDIEKAADNYDNAHEWLQKALEHAKKLEKRFPSDNEHVLGLLSFIYGRIAELERWNRHDDKALNWFYKSLEIDKRLAELFPNNIKRLENLSIMYQNIASAMFDLSNFNEAVEWFKKSLAVRMQIVEIIPNTMIVQQPIYNLYNIMATAELNAGNVNNAEMYHEKELAVIKLLIESYPEDVSLKNDCGNAYLKLGDLNVNKGEIQKAQQLYQEAIDDFKGALSIQSDNQNAMIGLIQVYDKLGELSVNIGNTDDAILCFQIEAAVISQILNENQGNNDFLIHLYGQTSAKQGALYSLNKDYTSAKESMAIAIDVINALIKGYPSNHNLQEELEAYQSFMEDLDKKQAAPQGFLSKLFSKVFEN